jgi:hypothetical protein
MTKDLDNIKKISKEEMIIIDWAVWLIALFLKLVLVLVLLEMFLLRLTLQWRGRKFYENQGVKFAGPFIPILSSFFLMICMIRKRPRVEYVPFYPLIK